MPEPCCFQVSPDDVSVRLDRFLDDNLPEVTRSQIKRLIDEGAVTLDGVTSKAGIKLRGSEEIRVVLPEPVATTAQAEAIPLAVLYEDSALIVVNKPAHFVVHPAPGHQSGTLVNALLHHQHLASQFKDHTIQRRYRSLVHGLVAKDKGSIDQAIGRHPVHRKKMSTDARISRNAVTHWKVLRRYEEDRLTLVDLLLETGRTHQIRVHLTGMGSPVVGDPLYGGASRAKSISDTVLRKMIVHLERQFLHAWQLGFAHPDGRAMLFQAALPQELQEILSYLEEKYNYEPAALAIKACAGPVETAY